MGHHIELRAMDGHRLGAYRADPDGQAIGGIVVLQEIFGVNHHIRSICDRLEEDAGLHQIERNMKRLFVFDPDALILKLTVLEFPHAKTAL